MCSINFGGVLHSWDCASSITFSFLQKHIFGDVWGFPREELRKHIFHPYRSMRLVFLTVVCSAAYINFQRGVRSMKHARWTTTEHPNSTFHCPLSRQKDTLGFSLLVHLHGRGRASRNPTLLSRLVTSRGRGVIGGWHCHNNSYVLSSYHIL